MSYDLRTFLDTVRREKPRDIIDVHRIVNPRHETAAIVTKLEQSYRYPVLYFRHVAGSRFPLASNVCGSIGRMALALGCSVRELPQRYAQACAQPIPPEVKMPGVVHERVFTGSKVSLECFPRLTYHEGDGPQPYITGSVVVARDPETGKSNLSFHRLMMIDHRTTAIYMAPGKHLDHIYRKYEAAGEPMPVAAFIGAHPSWWLGALYTGPSDTEEYNIIGGLRQAALPVVSCITQPLHVPADAEFVLEGTVAPRIRVPEGPFGEFTGYSTGLASCPTFTVTAITCRQEPIFQDIVSGHMEHLLLPTAPMEHHLSEIARAAVATTASVRIVLPLTVFVALNKHDDTEPHSIIKALLESDIYVKQVVVVDSDVDVSDVRQVATAVALHVRPDRDIYIHGPTLGTELDPACGSADGLTAKFGIDATLPLNTTRHLTRNKVPQALLDSIELSDLLGKP